MAQPVGITSQIFGFISKESVQNMGKDSIYNDKEDAAWINRTILFSYIPVIGILGTLLHAATARDARNNFVRRHGEEEGQKAVAGFDALLLVRLVVGVLGCGFLMAIPDLIVSYQRGTLPGQEATKYTTYETI